MARQSVVRAWMLGRVVGAIAKGMMRCWLPGVAALAALVSGPVASAGFINGGFENAALPGDQPFGPAWKVEYANIVGAGTYGPWSTTKPAGHPAALVVTQAHIQAPYSLSCIKTYPVLCGTQMARINDISGGKHATRISQTITLTPADLDDCGAATVKVCWLGVLDDPHSGGTLPAFWFELERTRNGVKTLVSSYSVLDDDVSKIGSGWKLICPSVWQRQTCTSLKLLDALPGDLLTLTMGVRDCGAGAHGATAFIDCVEVQPGYGSFNIEFSGNGCGDATIVLAPLLTPETWSNESSSGVVLPLRTGDFNGDGKADLVEYLSGGTIRILESNGSSFVTRFPVMVPLVPSNWSQLLVGDFNGDGSSDIAGWDGTSIQVRYTDATTLGGVTDFVSGAATMVVPGGMGIGGQFRVGDFNGDQIDDLVRLTTTAIEVATGTGTGPAPFNAFQAWAPSIPVGFAPAFTLSEVPLVCDFDGDGRDDLLFSLQSGVFVQLSDGTKFQVAQKWSAAVSSFFDWIVGNFDCNSGCDIVRRNPNTGFLEKVPFGSPTPAASPFDFGGVLVGFGGVFSNFSQISATAAPNLPGASFVVGDFDGNGRDDIVYRTSSGVVVLAMCDTECSCLFLKPGTPICDPLDATKYTLPVTITNRTGVAMWNLSFAPSGFTITPPNLAFSTPILPGRTRTETVTISGVTPGAFYTSAVGTVWTDNGDLRVCSDQICFVPPECDCMDGFGYDFYCLPDNSGTVCFDFSVQNTSGTPAAFVRLSPAADFSPNVIALNPALPTGATATVSGCQVEVLKPPFTALFATIELLDADGNVLCDEEIPGTDLPYCPKVLGWCCVLPYGAQSLTQAECAAAGGVFSSTTPPPNWCQIQLSPTQGTTTTLSTLGAAFLTVAPGQITFIGGLSGDGDDGALLSLNAARSVTVPLAIPLGALPIGAETIISATGPFEGNPGMPLGEAVIIETDGGMQFVHVEFGTVEPEFLKVFVSDGEGGASIDLPGPALDAVLSARPSEVSVQVSESGQARLITLRFDERTIIEFNGAMFIVRECQVLAATLLGGFEHITGIELRATGTSTLAIGPIGWENTPCFGDFNGDCRIDDDDADLLAAMISEGAVWGGSDEADLNGDGMADGHDLLLLLDLIGTVCDCADPGIPPPCPGDLNGDGVVDAGDLGVLLNAFGVSGAGDVNGDGVTDAGDLGVLLNVFGSVCG